MWIIHINLICISLVKKVITWLDSAATQTLKSNDCLDAQLKFGAFRVSITKRDKK